MVLKRECAMESAGELATAWVPWQALASPRGFDSVTHYAWGW